MLSYLDWYTLTAVIGPSWVNRRAHGGLYGGSHSQDSGEIPHPSQSGSPESIGHPGGATWP
jgi:hypothetical protein